MPRFKHYNYDQDAMVVINYQEQLQPGTFEHAVHYLIEHKLDLSVFHPKYRNEDTGRLAYDPAILLKIILFAYSKGITSSREMQWCCETNILFKALSCDTVPHFTTLASVIPPFLTALLSRGLSCLSPPGWRDASNRCVWSFVIVLPQPLRG